MISFPYKTAIGLNVQQKTHSCNDAPGYVEGPSRIESIVAHLKQSGIWNQCNIIQEHFPIDEGDLRETHDQNYVRCVAELRNKSKKALDELANKFDSVYLCQGTYEAACEAVACTRNMAALIAKRKIPNGFALIRPPGHHAQRNAANGFCVFNNVAQAAEEAYNFGEDRILIVDFDVHHGQGVQQSFYEEKRVMYCSIHRYEDGKFWPHLAESNFDHIGVSSGVGYNINIPLNELGCGDADYMAIFWNVIWPIASTYRPHFVVVAAGYDACQGDPIGAMDVSPDLFAHFVYHLKGLAGGKILLCLEDGYNERNVALCVERCIRILLGEAPNPLPKLPSPKRSTIDSCLNVISMLLPHWQQCFGFYAVDGTLHAGWEIHHPKNVFCAPPQRKRVSADRIDQSTLPQVSVETFPDEIGHVTALAYDPRVELHREEIDMAHVERPERTSMIAKRLRDTGLLRRCAILQPREATYDELRLVHQLAHIKHMEAIAEVDESERRREEDHSNSMYFCKESFRASIAAVGSILECVDAVLDEERKERARNAFALIRPPGHHATPSQAAGFCIFNNVAIAAKYAMEKYGLERILIVDWDVHHGNGIQEIFYSDPHVLYISLHRHDDGLFYPANEPKDVEDGGEGAGLGYSINIPFSHGRMSDNDYRMAFTKVVMPIAYEYSPQLVIVSSGFDAAYGDILGGYELSAQCYAQLTYQLGALAKGRIIVALEGGYSLTVLQDCAEAVVKTLLDRCLPLVSPAPLSCTKTSRTVVRRSAWDTIRRVCLYQSQYWACLNGLQMKLIKGAVELPEVSPEPEVLLSKTKLRDESESDESTLASESVQPSTEKMAKQHECNYL